MKKNVTVIVLFMLFSRLYAQNVVLKADTVTTDSIALFEPVFSSSADAAESESDQQDISNLLQASPDIYARFASFHYTAARFRLRGFGSENHLVMINGAPVNDPSTGLASWSSWGGLTDVTKQIESRSGVHASRSGFSGVGGFTNIEASPSALKKNSRFSYSIGNRNFSHRLIFTHATGMMRSGWAFCFAVSARAGNEVQIPGTYLRGQSYYAGVDRRISKKHVIGLVGFIAPLEQGRRSAATKEAYVLSANTTYNSSWGYQSGEKRNANVSKVTRPVFLLSHKFDDGEKGKLTSTFYLSAGKTKNSGLNWSDAPNPKPDYYRYLPGYHYLKHDSAKGDALTNAWQNESNRQINWDRMIQVNQNNLYSDPHLAGQSINTQETRARYIVEDQVEQLLQGAFNILYNRRLKDVFLSAGLNISSFKERKYKEVNDLLGASFWIDVDQFAENLGVEESIIQNDIDHPNRKVRQGEKFGYDYAFKVRRVQWWAQAERSWKKFDLYAATDFRYSSLLREGFTANGKFPATSKGIGQTLAFFNAGFKGGGTVKFTGRHFLTFNGVLLSRAPNIDNIYVSPRVRRDIVTNTGNEKVFGGDVSYHIRYSGFQFRISAYHSTFQDQVWLRTFWHDTYNNNINLIMTDLDQRHQGVEVGVEKDLFKRHTVQIIAGYGEYVYSGHPQLQAWQDNNAAALYKGRVVYLNNYRVGGTPQSIAAFGYKYNGRKNWFFNISVDYAGGSYVEPNPDRRTAEAIEKYQTGEEAYASVITQQEKLPGYYFVNAMAGKSLRIKKAYFLSMNLSVNNLLNNHRAMISGFEQMRWDASEITMFAPKYTYLNGFSFLFTISMNFR